MPRAGSICKVGGCPKRAVRDGFCEKDAQARDLSRGTTTQRHYGSAHQATRAALLPKARNTPCPICGRLMRWWHPLDLHHSTPLAVDPTSVGDQIVHQACNLRSDPPPDTDRPPPGWRA